MPIRTDSGLKLTYEDYVKIPDDGRRHEIIDGRHIVSPAPRPRHQAVLRNLMRVLDDLQVSGRAEVLCSPIDVHLTETDIVQPDIIAVARKSAQLIGEVKIEGAPELVVEILSPSTRRLDRGAKRGLYEAAGIQEYWIIDPEAQTMDHLALVDGRFTEKHYSSGTVASTAFPGFEVDLGRIF